MSPNVLILDDEPAVGRAITRVLAAAGFTVTVATDLASARTALASQAFSVIISDERMPDISGVEFLHACSGEYPDVTRILLTGYADPQTAADAIRRAEIFRLVFKPWSETELIAAVREAAWRNALLEAGDQPPETAPFAAAASKP